MYAVLHCTTSCCVVLWYVYICLVMCDWDLQVMEAVASVVSCLQGDTQAAATRALLDPIITPLQARLQQPQPNGAGPAQQPSEDVEHVGAFVDRLGTVFR